MSSTYASGSTATTTNAPCDRSPCTAAKRSPFCHSGRAHVVAPGGGAASACTRPFPIPSGIEGNAPWQPPNAKNSTQTANLQHIVSYSTVSYSTVSYSTVPTRLFLLDWDRDRLEVDRVDGREVVGDAVPHTLEAVFVVLAVQVAVDAELHLRLLWHRHRRGLATIRVTRWVVHVRDRARAVRHAAAHLPAVLDRQREPLELAREHRGGLRIRARRIGWIPQA